MFVLASGNIEDFDHVFGCDYCHVAAASIDADDFTFILGEKDGVFDLALVTADFKFIFGAHYHGVCGKSGDIGVCLKVSEQLRTIFLAHLVNLGKLTVVEKYVVSAAVDTLDVHAEGHNNLEIRVLRLFIAHSYFNGLV